jgi:hypothetical protein
MRRTAFTLGCHGALALIYAVAVAYSELQWLAHVSLEPVYMLLLGEGRATCLAFPLLVLLFAPPPSTHDPTCPFSRGGRALTWIIYFRLPLAAFGNVAISFRI